MHICADHLYRLLANGNGEPGDTYTIVAAGPACAVCEAEHEAECGRAA